MKIYEAAEKALKIINTPVKAKKIYDVIVENNFYKFGAEKPIDALTGEIMRRCSGYNISSGKNKKNIFFKAGPLTFGLLKWLPSEEKKDLDIEEDILNKEMYNPDAELLDTSLFLEKEWHRWLYSNLEKNFLKGLGFGKCSLFDDDKQKHKLGKYDTGEVGEIDLLLRNEKNNIIVVELKRKGIDETIGQICRYVGWVEEKLAKNKSVFGIIIAQNIDRKLKYAIKPIKEHIFYQQLKFNVEFGESSKKSSKRKK